jgi:hypothetical protein
MKPTCNRIRGMLTAREFVSEWAEVARVGGSYNDLVAATGISLGAVYARACRYRKAGVNLPTLCRPDGQCRKPLDVSGLNALLEGE